MNVAGLEARIAEKPLTEEATVPSQTVWSVITSLTSGGAEMLVVNLNREFVKAGWRHHVIALCDATELGNSETTEAALRQRIEDTGGQFTSLKLPKSRNPLSAASPLRRLLRGEAPDVVHLHTARAVPMLALSRYRGPTCLTHHNSRLSFPRHIFPALDAYVDEYVAISPETEDIYARLSKRPVTTIPNGPGEDFAASEPRKSVGTPARILSVGAISEQKNYPLLLDVARRLAARLGNNEPPQFAIAGSGRSLEQFRAEAERLPDKDMVRFLGERGDVPDLLDETDIFLNTSLYEGQSVAILEAMAKGLPVVATDVPGNRDLIAHGKNGLLCPVDNPDAIAESILTLVRNSEIYSRLSAGALATGKRFSIGNTAARHIDLYRRLISAS